ncbi:Organelle RRM domain-containing protein 6, chloroplastic [Glycine max]|nr:Organelle RRM domain-containing protein 6, chloroplastic [Glycine max]
MANNVVFVVPKVAPGSLPSLPITNNALYLHLNFCQTKNRTASFPSSSSILRSKASCSVLACLPPASSESSTSSSTAKPSFPSPPTKLYGYHFVPLKRVCEMGLRILVNWWKLVMDRIANGPRGFAFLRYATEEESQKAIEGMHRKFLDGRVIFVEVAKPRSELPQRHKEDTRL